MSVERENGQTEVSDSKLERIDHGQNLIWNKYSLNDFGTTRVFSCEYMQSITSARILPVLIFPLFTKYSNIAMNISRPKSLSDYSEWSN